MYDWRPNGSDSFDNQLIDCLCKIVQMLYKIYERMN